jgi:dihydroorotate dehydrogenase (NAD+) catalytic subunit
MKALGRVVSKVCRVSKFPVIVKLAPDVPSIKEATKVCERSGADALSLINTIPGMAIDIKTKKPRLANVTGGLSGPAIKPIGIRCVWQAKSAVKIPIIGMGGIANAEDALEYMIAGASAFCIGTANFTDPFTSIKIVEGLKQYLKENKISSIKKIIGSLRV